MSTYCHHCIDHKAHTTIEINGREHPVCRNCFNFFKTKDELPDLKVSIFCQTGYSRPPLLEEMERRMGGDGSFTLKCCSSTMIPARK